MLALSNYRRKLFDLQTFQNQAHIISVTGIIIYFLGTYYLYTHFRPLTHPGGASGGQNLKMALPGGYLEDRIWVLWNFCPIFGHLTLFWWLKFEILTLVI